MTNRAFRGFLLMLPVLSLALRQGEADGLPAFDHQLELFTRLAIEGKVAEAAVFLREPAFLQAADRDGHTALFGATVAGNLQILDRVLALLPKLELGDVNGATALFYAVDAGLIGMAERLIQRGADSQLGDNSGLKPRQVAAAKGYPKMVDLLLRYR